MIVSLSHHGRLIDHPLYGILNHLQFCPTVNLTLVFFITINVSSTYVLVELRRGQILELAGLLEKDEKGDYSYVSP